jgi:hypothetical protein
MSADYTAQAVTLYRVEHPEVDDLPDEAVGSLLKVQGIALGLAFKQLNKDIADAFALARLRRWLRERR